MPAATEQSGQMSLESVCVGWVDETSHRLSRNSFKKEEKSFLLSVQRDNEWVWQQSAPLFYSWSGIHVDGRLKKKNVIFYKQKWHWKQHIFPSTSQPSVYPRFLQFRADLKLCGCTSGKSKGVTARGVWCDHRNWVWNTAKAQIQSQWYLKNGLQGELMVKTRKEKIIRSCRGRITGFTRQNT